MATKRNGGAPRPAAYRRLSRHGLRAAPAGLPQWLRIAKAYLYGLQVKDKGAHYRPMVRRVAANWHTVAQALDGLADKFTRYRRARELDELRTSVRLQLAEKLTPVELSPPELDKLADGLTQRVESARREQAEAGGDRESRAEAARHVAQVFESFAYWAAEDANRTQTIRLAEADLKAYQDRITRTAEELCRLIAESEHLAHRHGLAVLSPTWVQDLDEVMADLAYRFPRWGQRPEVARLIERDRRELVADRPKMTDAIESALSIGMLRGGTSSPVRHPDTRQWLRTHAPEVIAADWVSAEALRVRSGSGGKAAAARLRVLFAGLEKLTEHYATGNQNESPVEWLTARQIAELCNVFTGDAAMTAETVDKARRAYLRDQDPPG
jgi:hypothetical protein